ncbi:MAG: PQQ-binding-like beta-propeller repeat protein [Sphingobacteriales bacterium]|nr:PQQ-binding-like beta-propeller repeat protein [Sphingobacteriales bacterium]MBI3718420.1 PQQ-binding-like beta-propeller repeat protein [Sphingobacteriales bacterium]
MHKSIVFLLIIISTRLFSQSVMFRGNAKHESAVTTSTKLVYDTKDWSYAAGSPIRSTPLATGNALYFGTTKGEFICIDKKSGKQLWKYVTGEAINSSAAIQNGKVFFSDNHQTVYALNNTNGKLIWKFTMGNKLAYPWRFDYYYSSPTLYNDKLVIGGDDGNMYMLNQSDGKLVWKHSVGNVIRSSAAINNGEVLFGDVNGFFYSLDVNNGKQKWAYKTAADTLKNEDWSFDRKAILSSAVITGNKIIFGSREGFIYCLSDKGNLLWKNNHRISWVISTLAVKDSFVVTGTSDGHFVQAVNLNTGKDIWKFRPNSLFWSSPTIVDDKVYIGSFDGVLYCLDLKTGKRISQFTTDGMIMSSAVWSDNRLYMGCDDGNLYSLKGHLPGSVAASKQYVYYDKDVKGYYHNGADLRVKNYLSNWGYLPVSTNDIDSVLMDKNNTGAVIVLATNYLPYTILKDGKSSLLRKFLDAGGRLVMTGMNPIIYQWDEKGKQPYAFNIPLADSVLDLKYGPNDTRGMKGQYTCFATEKGRQLNLPDYWTGNLSIDASQVNIILGKTENGDVSAFIKNYKNNGKLVQLWINPDLPQNLDAVVKAAEWELR